MNLVQLAGMLPRDPLFREWVGGFVNGDPVSADEAAQFIRVVCKVESRRELATDVHAADRFNHFLRRPFLAWKEEAQFEGESGPAERPRRAPVEARM
ncbi:MULTISPECIES: hypothetical protein [pseudomallei group]|nr:MULTISPECIES: hypothetical protein [pseudomallei group]MCS6455954.1 hypothetical protein [Burkholderia thailandensis]MCS6482669.1 hypothetical protein [Burkholderia thailandensis]MCS6499028.1 hypothetical protein [Burkholderia thailandensis]WRS69090.1 hypothetical protein U9S59_20265 [Burkholderia thailandensis]CAJ9925087.1 Uncharacterised protein [Burkholderia pseudomallei]